MSGFSFGNTGTGAGSFNFGGAKYEITDFYNYVHRFMIKASLMYYIICNFLNHI